MLECLDPDPGLMLESPDPGPRVEGKSGPGKWSRI